MKLLEIETETEGSLQESTHPPPNKSDDFEQQKCNMFKAIFFMIAAGLSGLGTGTIFKSVKRHEGTNLIDFTFIRNFIMSVFCISVLYLK